MKGWTKKLTKKEMKHVRADVGNNFDAVKRQMDFVNKCRAEGTSYCHDCAEVGRKLGLVD